jgi:ABC-type nitrate/sulfonate/bicarbonate transport system substrate-binding protein
MASRRERQRLAWTPGTRRAMLLCALSCAALLGSLGGTSANAAPTTAQHQSKLYGIRLGVVGGVLDPALLELMTSGTALKAGVDLNVIPFDNGVTQLPALQNGNIDVAYFAAGPLLSLAARGADIQAVAIAADLGKTNCLITHPNNGINGFADLKGKSVGIVKGSVNEWALGLGLEKVGLTLHDVTEQNVLVALQPAAYQSNSVDVLFANQVGYVKSLSEGAKLLTCAGDIPGAKISGLAFYVFRGDFIRKYPAAVAKFIRALELATQDVRVHPGVGQSLLRDRLGLTVKEAATVMKEVTYPTVAQQISRSYPFNLTHGGAVGGATSIRDWELQNGLLSQSVNVPPLFNGSILAAYAKKYKAKK